MSVQFDKRLAELDAYLQMLIQESDTIDKKLEEATSELEQEGLQTIKKNLETLLGSIKHAIVLLQIAKVSIKTEPSSSEYQVADTKSAGQTPIISKREKTSSSTSSPQPPARSSRRRIQQQRQVSQQASNASHQPSPGLSRKLQHSSSTSPASSLPGSNWSSSIELPNKSSDIQHSAESRHAYRDRSLNFNCLDKDINSAGNCEPVIRDGASTSVNSDSINVADFDGNGDDEDDDDAFFDAADEHQNHSAKETITDIVSQATDSSETNEQKTKLNSINNLDNSLISTSSTTERSNMNSTNNNNNNNNIVGEESIDWDALYEEEDEEDLGSLESQGSVIKHLLSQIRIGMDLTKVILPTFILERRSLLEMYADFFAHPDLFSAIPDYKTPEERMVQLVRWYLSAFHAGRKSSVAKKPYNPILGEIFLCHWNLNNTNDNINKKSQTTNLSGGSNLDNLNSKSIHERSISTESSSSVDDIEKFSKRLPENSLLFIAEQVSHHPPVSAFYTENREKQISCCAHIYTKSKYLGLSVGVHNIGQGVIKLLKHKETYVCTFPSAYGRSILSVPWVELGGSVNITCEETGYSANIEFVTKPFYGGKKHRVMGEILRPNKEPFMTIDGEWNGQMYAKPGPNSSEKQMFVDTTSLPVIKKNVRSISEQESFESRNVWKEVTRALKLRDVTTATAAKSFIEQRQRDLLKNRMEKGLKWKTRYFETIDNGWAYAKSLDRHDD